MTTGSEREFDPVWTSPRSSTCPRRPLRRGSAFLLEDAGANAGQDLFTASAFQNDGIDPGAMQELSQQKARRTEPMMAT